MGEGEGTFYTEWEETFESFDQMGLHENLLRGIYAYGAALPPELAVAVCCATLVHERRIIHLVSVPQLGSHECGC